MNLRYCMRDANNCGISDHPQITMKKLNITYQHPAPQNMGDQWWFWNCENVPDKLPGFLTDLDVDPMECIGLGLSEEDAIKIRDYSSGKI